ncbi:MAG: nuclear transport factor 2 family protein [Dehalococcoidia bacterium]|nr:nuclear transport factor 2 family protein [Dehalococcoidia bacterium]MCB9487080.1 nuclear transport factor 2 family protein [Thermoflexaceae bacterium]
MTERLARDVALEFIELYNDGTPELFGSERVWGLYHEDVDWHEMPTRAFPAGRTGNRDAVLVATRGAAVALRNRHVTLRELVADGNRAAIMYTWEATIATGDFAFLGLGPGDIMQMEIAQFIEVSGGKIIRSTEHLCLGRLSP